MKTSAKILFIWAAAFSFGVQAHGRYIVPSHTSLSSETPDVVTVDISISNDFFHPDMSYGGKVVVANDDPMVQMTAANSQFQVTTPSKKIETDYDVYDFGRKSVAAITLSENGSYKLSMVQNPTYMTLFTKEDSSPARLPGKKKDLTNALPKNAKAIRTLEVTGRTETYISRNQLNNAVFEISKIGLELSSGTHPNDLFAGESINFSFSMHGKPAQKGLPVKITRGNTRFRNSRDSLELKTDDKGAIHFSLDTAGLYLLEIESMSKPVSTDADIGSTALYMTLEVLPE